MILLRLLNGSLMFSGHVLQVRTATDVTGPAAAGILIFVYHEVVVAGSTRVLRKEQNFLGRSDISIAVADSNSSALELHKEKQADLIVSRLDDKELSGEKLCSLIRKDSKLRSVSIIIVCSGDNADLKRCVGCSANAFISSPLNTAILLQEAYQLLNIAQRKSCRIELKVKCEGTVKGRPFAGHAENISTTGMLLSSEPSSWKETSSFVRSLRLAQES